MKYHYYIFAYIQHYKYNLESIHSHIRYLTILLLSDYQNLNILLLIFVKFNNFITNQIFVLLFLYIVVTNTMQNHNHFIYQLTIQCFTFSYFIIRSYCQNVFIYFRTFVLLDLVYVFGICYQQYNY